MISELMCDLPGGILAVVLDDDELEGEAATWWGEYCCWESWSRRKRTMGRFWASL
jgi:hypothetical protein